jgi:hypothetical protein
MKTNDYLLITAVSAYSFLFYQQNAGINFAIFNMVLIVILLIRNQSLLSSLKWNWAAAMCLLSSACIVMHSSALSIFANIVSLMLLSSFSFNLATSSIFSVFFSVYSILSSIVYVIIDCVRRGQKTSEEQEKDKNYTWLGVVIVSVIAILFFAMYKNSNPIFAEYTKWINLDFISVGWFFFTMAGFFLMYAFLYRRSIPPLEEWENSLSTVVKPEATNSEKRLHTEKISLITLFTLLNLMLLVINIGDINTILLNGNLPAGVKHSDFVHNGVGTLIFSILFAIGIIMYFLRGQLNFYKGHQLFKILVLLWIVQNILMLASTSFRNHLYILEYTLTYKRIGVYVWLGLAGIGLIITALKIYSNRSNWYLIKTNVAVWLTALSIGGIVDWDLLITRYNLQNKNINEIDYNYLFSLSDTNIPELLSYCKMKAATETIPLDRKENGRLDYYYGPNFNYLNLLRYKLEDYLRNYNDDWRSWDMRDDRIMRSLKLGE